MKWVAASRPKCPRSPRAASTRRRARVADRLDAFGRMYLAHASREDTIVFPAFRDIAGDEYAELGEQFEAREHRIVGEHGFDRAVEEVAQIERAFHLQDLALFTPPREEEQHTARNL